MKFHQILLIGFIAALLCGCERNLYLVDRKSGTTAHTTVTRGPGQFSGDLEITIEEKTYRGRWVAMAQGGTVGFSNAVAFSGLQSATAFGTFAGAPMQANGTILASAADGSQLRCEYNYNDWGHTGVGVCQNSKGKIYDLQIN